MVIQMVDREPLNVAEALQRIGGDEELLREIAGLCLEEYPKLLGEIRSAIAARKSKDLEHGAHTMKGVVSNFAAENARQAAFALEMIGRSGDLNDAGTALTELEKALRALHPALEKLARG
jgi:HPt (histidine-containing phosphotransfer) domain-containing protein